MKENVLSKIGQLIKKARQEAKITQCELAKKAFGTNDKGRISNIEQGKFDVNVSTIGKVLEALGKEIDFK
jgi:transcriptional regulator with XRE-family HTH domain